MSSRAGIGWDSHRLEAGETLMLGGVEIDHDAGLAGHSDADVLTHAVIDALLGACSMGDIGMWFPDTDDEFRGADSMALLRVIVGEAEARGFAVVHCDTTIILERPRLAAYRDDMCSSLASGLRVPFDSVNVKATTGEGMGFVGRGEGCAALAVVTVESSETGFVGADDLSDLVS
jgi:2-C-methyl-D-erythritol 2,4-cyclodiphosphate synthase